MPVMLLYVWFVYSFSDKKNLKIWNVKKNKKLKVVRSNPRLGLLLVAL